jgi:hypothetical protein
MNKSLDQSSRSRCRRHPAFFIISSFCLLPSALAPASPWTLTTADFQTQQVELQSLSADSLVVTTPGGPKTVPVTDVLQLSREVTAAATKPAAFVLTLSTGDRLTGTPAALDGEMFTWASPSVGAMKVSLRDVQSLSKASAPASPADHPPAEDTLTLANGDIVKGIVSGFADGNLSVTQGGDTLPVPLDAVATLRFASPTKPRADAPERSFRVRLSDGSTLTAPSVEIASGNATLRLADNSSRPIPLASIASVEQLNGPVVFLSSLTPTEDVQRPYLGDPWPARFDRGVTGEPLRTPQRAFARGIGVHAYSRLTFDLDPSYKSFRTQFAIDTGGPFANVTARILLDGKSAFERADVTSTTPSTVVSVPLNGAKTLTLEVDYGRSNDTQDRFMWLEPALLRAEISAPTPAPAPAAQ